jgi:hypothetical protein
VDGGSDEAGGGSGCGSRASVGEARGWGGHADVSVESGPAAVGVEGGIAAGVVEGGPAAVGVEGGIAAGVVEGGPAAVAVEGATVAGVVEGVHSRLTEYCPESGTKHTL